MDLSKWSNVLVEWVNCLKITAPIQTLNDLKGEVFFKKLLSVITGDYTPECIPLTDFIKKHYPDYQLPGESTMLADSVELCNTCSLLLHYACVVDGRHHLTAPLCHGLSPASQIRVRSFLEVLSLAPAVTRQLLNIAVLNSQPPAPPTPGGPTEKEPPLQEYLRTPLKKTMDAHKQHVKNLESQLEMERFEKEELQEELNLQQRANDKLEKTVSDRQAEIRSLKEQLLAAKEPHFSAHLSHSPYRETRAESRRLRMEIDSLEKYVDVAHAEQAALQVRVDKAETRSHELEKQLVRWRGEAENATAELMELKQANGIMSTEMVVLREKCAELSAHLAELRPKKGLDESLDSSGLGGSPLHNISGVIDNETLAQTVVDLQLVDALNENKSLKNEILELQKQVKDSDSLFVEVKSKLSETEFNLNYFKTENENLSSDLKENQEKLQKIDKMITNFSKKHNLEPSDADFYNKVEEIFSNYDKKIKTLQENEQQIKKDEQKMREGLRITEERIRNIQKEMESYSQEISSYKTIMQNQTDEIEQLNKNIEKLTSLKTANEEKITELIQQVLEYKLKLKETQIQLAEMAKKVDSLNEEKNQSQDRIYNSMKKLTNTERCLEQTLTKFKKLDALFVVKLQELNKNQIDYDLKCDQNEKLNKENKELNTFVQKLQQEVTDQIKTKTILQEKYKQSTEKIAKLDTELQSYLPLPAEIQNYQKETENLRLNLTEKETKLQEFNSEILSLQNQLKTVLENLNAEHEQRNNLQINIKTLTSKLQTAENKMADLQSQNCKMDDTVSSLNQKLAHEISTKLNLEHENLKLIKENSQFQQQIKELTQNNSTLNLKLEEIIDTVTNEKAETTVELNTLNTNIKMMETQLENSKESIKCLEEEKQHFLTNIENLNKKYATEKMAARNCQLQNNELISELQEIHEKLKILEKDGENNIETIKQLIINKKDLLTKINNLETDLKDTKSSNTTLEDKLDQISKCFEDLQISNTENIEKIKTLQQNLEVSQKTLQEKENIFAVQKHQLENNLQVLQIEIKEKEEKLQKDLENTEKILKEKETKIKDLILQKSELTEQLNNLQQQLDDNTVTLNQQLNDLKTSCDVQKTEMIEKITKFESESTELKENLQLVETELIKILTIIEKENLQICFQSPHDLQTQISNLETSIYALISERRSGKSEFVNLKQKITDLEQVVIDLTQKNVSLQQNLDLNKSNLKTYQKKLADVNQKLDETVAHTETLLKNHQIEISQLETELKLKQDKLSGEGDVLMKLKHEKDNLQVLVNEKDEFISELEKKIQEFDLDFESSENLPQKISQISNFCTDSLNKFISIYTIVFETDFPGYSTEIFDKIIKEINCFKVKTKQLSDLNLQIAKYQKVLSEKQLECQKHSEELSLLKTANSNLQRLAREAESERELERRRELVEEKSQLKSENDTLRYKRQRDREEFQRRLEEKDKEHEKQMQKVREEYEEKLGKMKHKIVKLYREEVEKEKKKVCTLQHGQTEETIASLKSQLWLTGNKYTELKRDYESLKSRMCDLTDRRAHTLPRDTKLETAGLSIEDEQGEMWNNTYLADLQAGRCETETSSRASTSSRLSELQFRNSLCPPHLKSSYPAETQTEMVREEDIKGHGQLDESLSSRLLPGERKRKDWGQTLYKKPGPPTPSKHGGSGRTSLQGNEVLREHNKPSTPSRLRALFSRSGKDQENVSTSTPRSKTKRRSIFRM